jgi:broad specificity phosphatase PhoE
MSLEKHPTRFGLIRHAPTVWNREKRIQGQLDSTLTTEGETCGRIWGQALSTQPWDRIVSSDLGRALRTAELINMVLNVPMTCTPLLREVDWGEWTGQSIKQIKAENPGVLSEMEKAGWAFRPPGGEDRIEVWQRAHRALTDAAEKWMNQAILVVTHEGVIKCLVYRLLQRRFLPDEPPLLKSGYLHRLIYDHSGLRIDKINALTLVLDRAEVGGQRSKC